MYLSQQQDAIFSFLKLLAYLSSTASEVQADRGTTLDFPPGPIPT